MRCGKPVRAEEEFCSNCAESPGFIDEGKSLWLHKDPVPGAVYALKYRNKRNRAVVFAEELALHYGGQIEKWNIHVIVPIPLHPSRQRKRGYNQSAILAGKLSCLTGIPVREDILFRIRNTKPQKMLGKSERKQNLKGAFAVSRRWKGGENVLLIDDIYTTGATVEKAAEMLKMAGAQNVYFLTISIGQDI